MKTTTHTTTFAAERYGVRADWSHASCPVEQLGSDGHWHSTAYQVADFSHDPDAALRCIIERTVIDGGDDPAECSVEIDNAIAEAD